MEEKALNARINQQKKQLRKSIKSRKPELGQRKSFTTPLLKSRIPSSESANKSKIKDIDHEGTILPVAAWAAPQRLSGMKKKGQLAPLTKRVSKQKQHEEVEAEAVEEDSVISKMESYLSLVSEQERRAKAHFLQISVLKYSDQSIILDRLYDPIIPILELKKDILHILNGGDAESPPEYDPDDTTSQSLEGIDHMVLRLGEMTTMGPSSHDTAINAARENLSVLDTWYSTPKGIKAKSQEQLRVAQRRVGHLNVAARKKNMNKSDRKGLLSFGAERKVEPSTPKSVTREEHNPNNNEKSSDIWGGGSKDDADEYSVDAIEARRKRLLLFCEVWDLDDDHDHLLEVVKTFGGNRKEPEDIVEGYHNINDFIVNRSRPTAAMSTVDNKGRDINSWQKSNWDRSIASEWQPDEKYEEDSSLSSIKQADRLIARARAQRHAQSLEKRRLLMLLRDVETWHGLLVLDGRVTKIHLAHLKPPLTGRLDQSVQLGLLTGLVRINLSDNKLVGTIPGKALRRLLNLTSLNLSHNQFTGQIPCDDLGYLTVLTDLRLGANRLTGVVKGSLCHCSSLRTLDLSSNYLEGELPEQIGGLKQLLVLNLSRNSFTGWLKKWIGMASIQRLSLQHNHLRGALPDALGRLFRCEYLHLNDNRFDGELDVHILSAMHYGVREIHLQGNRFFDDDTEKNFQAVEEESSFLDDDASDDSESSRRRVKLLEAKSELEEMFPECSVLI